MEIGNNLKILDCTLRDGGYYTQWDFDEGLVDIYINSFNSLPVDYLEIGYRSKPLNEYFGEYFYCPTYIIEKLRMNSTKKLSIMLNEKDFGLELVEDVLNPCLGFVDLIRIAVNPDNFLRALKLAEKIRDLGFEVGFNVMYMSTWRRRKGFIDMLSDLDGNVDYFYMVDSYGSVFPEEVKNLINSIKEKTSDVKIGFHGHNNLELALINTLTAVENGAEIIDATVTGMGRGAGNLKTELLLTTLHQMQGIEVDFNALSTVVNEFQELQKKYSWGTNLPYMVSGANSLPQKDVMNWVTARFYSFNSIIRALHNQKKGIEDNQKLKVFKPLKTFESAVMIGGGPNAKIHASAVKEFILKQQEVCVIHASSKNAKNYQELNNDQFFCLVGNEGHRLEKVFEDIGDFKDFCVLPPFPRKMGTYIPKSIENNCFELEKVTFINELFDTHTVIALQTAINLGVKNLYLVGYDGYSGSIITTMEQQLFKENELIFGHAQKHLNIISLVPTKYSIQTKSIYSII